jgi:glutamine amidotransferase
MNVLVIDCNTNNLLSVTRALERANSNVLLCRTPEDVDSEFTHILLPGIGTFANGISNLQGLGWDVFLRVHVTERRIPMLGICLGMQMLASAGEEGGHVEGLGLVLGRVTRLVPRVDTELIPHVGWNEVHGRSDCPLLEGIPDGSDFYFVHSFHFQTENDQDRAAVTPYCGEFTSIVQRDNVLGVQFHPEKSGRPGLRLLENFLRLGA